MWLRKREVVGGESPGFSAAQEGPLDGKLLVALVEFLAVTRWPDGSLREPGSLTLFVDEGTPKACLNDKGQGLVAFVSGSSLTDLLLAIEDKLRDGSLDWRRSRDRAGRGRRSGP